MTWERFLQETPRRSIALDGVVLGGPNYDEAGLRINFDHHDNVVREATMSTARQVLFAIKGGLMEAFGGQTCTVYINDTDEDTCLATWLLLNYKQFEHANGIPVINQLLELNDRLDITGGAFPMNLSDRLMRRHAWVFGPYKNLRKSGALAVADEPVMRDNLEAVLHRITAFHMGNMEEGDLDHRHTILYEGHGFKIVDEIGGNEARYHLFSQGMHAFISIIARRPDGKVVYTIGRRSKFIRFPVRTLYGVFNHAEGLAPEQGWNGSDIIGGSSRLHGSAQSWQQLRDLTISTLSSNR